MSILCRNNQGTFFNGTLVKAIKQRNNTEVWTILQKVNPCKLKTSLGTTLLHYAAEFGNAEFAQQLLDLGLDVNTKNQFGQSPLMLAIEANQEKTTGLLLKAKANIFLPDSNGRCALGQVFNNNYITEGIRSALLDNVTVESLIENIDYVKNERFQIYCPLYNFIPLGNAKITQILLESGSAVDAKNQSGETALCVAVKLLDLENVQTLLKFNANVNVKTDVGRIPLSYIPVWGIINETTAVKILKVLITAGANLNDPTFQNWLMEYFLKFGDREIIRALLQSELNLHTLNNHGLRLMHYLAMNKNPDIFKELQSIDCNMNYRIAGGHTMLHLAADAGNASSVKFLLERGFDVNVKDAYDLTPLYYATKGFNVYVTCVEILLDYGGDPHICTVENRRTLHGAWGKIMSNDVMTVMTPIIANLAFIEASGQSIKPYMRDQIMLYELLQGSFNSCKLHLEDIKLIKIGKSITLFDFLTADDRDISRFARDEKLVINLTDKIKEYSTSCYYRMLHKQLLKWNYLVQRRRNIVNTIHQLFDELFDISIMNVAEKIVRYLNDNELYTELDESL